MSNGNGIVTLALGAGGGLALWYLLREDKHKSSKDAPAQTTSAAATPRACTLRLDPSGLTADGARVSVGDAVARCKVAGRADVTVVEGAPAQTYADLMSGLGRAGVPASAQRNARRHRRARRSRDGVVGISRGVLEPARNAETSQQFTLITYTQGLKAAPRLRWIQSDSPVTWAEARDRLGAARILDLQLAGRTREPGGWMLSIDPRHFRADRAELLPGDSDG